MAKLKIDLVVDDKGSIVVQGFGNKVDKVMWSSRASVNSLAAELKVAGAAVTGVITTLGLAGSKITDIGDQYTLLDNRLKLVTDSSEQLGEVQGKLYQISLDTHQSYSDTTTLLARFDRATEDFGYTQQQVLDVTKSVNEAILVSGANSAESGAAIVQLSQGMASGVLRGQELNSVMEQTPRVARMIADGLGVPIGKLRELGEEGQLTTEKVVNALLSQSETVHKEFTQMTVTAGQSWQDVKTVFNSIIFDGSQSASVTSILSGELQNLATVLDDNRDEIVEYFAAGVQGAVNFAAEAKRIGTESLPYLESAGTGVKKIYEAAKKLDELGVGPSNMEWGIIGYALLRGGPQAAALTTALITINNQLKNYNMNLGQMVKDSQDGWFYMTQMWDGITGKKDWNTGEPIIKTASESIREEIKQLETTLAEAGDPVGEFFRKMFTGSAKSEEQIASINRLQERIDELKRSLNTVSEDQSGVLAPSWEGPGPAFDRTSEAVDNLNQSLKHMEPTSVKVQLGLGQTEEELEKMGRAALEAKYRSWELTAEFEEHMDALSAAAVNAELDTLFEGPLGAFEEVDDKVNELTQYMEDRWREGYDGMQGVLVDWMETGEVSFDSMRDMFERMLYEMTAAWLMNVGKMTITDLFTGGTMSFSQILGLDKLTGGGGLLSPVTNGLGLASGFNTVKDWIGIGGAGAIGTTAMETEIATALGFSGGTEWLTGTVSAAEEAIAEAIGLGAEQAFTQVLPTLPSMAGGTSVNAGTQLALAEGAYGPGSGSAGLAALGGGALTALAPVMITAFGEMFGSKYDRSTVALGDGEVSFRNRSGDLFADLNRSLDDSLYHIKNRKDSEESLQMWLDQGSNRVKALAQTFNDSTAQMALGVDGSVGSMDYFLDHLAGYDVSMEESATILWLAKEAANGNSAAVSALQEKMFTLSPTSEQARTGVMGIISALNDLSATDVNIDVKVNQEVVQSVASQNATLHGTVSDYTYVKGEQLYGYGYSDWLQENHAVGGIYTRPTLLPGSDGRLHQVAEAGYAEAIIPLPDGAQTIPNLVKKIDALAARQSMINLHVVADAKIVNEEMRIIARQVVVDSSERNDNIQVKTF